MTRPLLLLFCFILSSVCRAQDNAYTGHEHGGSDGGIVGKTDGTFAVSPTGQATYEIPIPALPGTGGMKPCLSIAYSSATKDGLLGYGFDLTGLSVISRTPSDRYHDGMVKALNFTDGDRFALDGQRLVPYSYEYGKDIYRTEPDSYAKIMASGGDTSPTSFTVYTKSGLTYEYAPLSVALGGGDSGKTLFWLVTKISDTAGNWMRVQYDGNAAENDYRVSRIDYTGNDRTGLAPYASVRFSYTDNPYSPPTYVGGATVRKGKVMSAVTLCYGERAVRTLEMGYTVKNRKYLLTTVTERAADGTCKNPTRFSWETVDNFGVKNINYTGDGLIHNATLTVGDYNGDGMADVFVTPQDKKAGWTGWKLFLSNGNGLTLAARGDWEWSGDELEQVVSGDFNGDGCDDIAVKRARRGGYHNCDLYLSTGKDDTSLKYSRCVQSLSIDFAMQTAELNGDGAADLLLLYSGRPTCQMLLSEAHGGTLLPLKGKAYYDNYTTWDRVEFGDFNGDGLTDILHLTGEGCRVLTARDSTFVMTYRADWPTKDHDITLGDFNGDGKTDLLLTGWPKDPNSAGWNDWCLLFSTGACTFKREYRAKPFDARGKQLFVADINGDGYDDIHAVDKVSPGDGTVQPQVWLNDGNGLFYAQVKGCGVYATDKWRFYAGDFNGDGKTDFVCTSDWNRSRWDGYQLLVMPEGMNNLLSSITDGLGNRTDIHYRPLSDSTVYKRGSTYSWPLSSVGLSWPVVASVDESPCSGYTRTTAYRYADALMHREGRGLLGFARTEATDLSAQTTDISTCEVNTDRWVTALKAQQTRHTDGTLLSESLYTNSVLTQPGHAAVFALVPTAVRQKTYEHNTGATLSDVYTETVYDLYGNPTRITVDNGTVQTVTDNTYDNDGSRWLLGRLTASTVTKTAGSGESIVRTSTFEYDSNTGLLAAEVFEPQNTAAGYRKTYTRDLYGNVVSNTVAPCGGTPRTEQTAYDGTGRFMASSTDALGFVTAYTVDESLGVVTETVDPNGLATRCTYDSFGQLLKTATPLSVSAKATGWCSGMADAPEGAVFFGHTQATGTPPSTVYCDSYGRTLRTVTQVPGGKKVYADVVYDRNGRVAKTSEPYYPGDPVLWSTNTYDAVGRTVRQTHADGTATTFAYDGLTTSVTDALGNMSSKTVDTAGRLAVCTDAAGGRITYGYNADGNCTLMQGPRTTVRAEYDLAGHRTMLDDPDAGRSLDTYDAFGQLVSHTDAHGTTHYIYDRGGRLTEERRPDMTFTTAYDHALKGAVDMVANDMAATRYAYDSYGRVIEETTVAGGKTFTTQTSYNDRNLVDCITYPAGLVVQHRYDDGGHLMSLSNRDNGTVYWTLEAVNARGQAERELYGNGTETVTAHDAATGLVTAVSAPQVQLSRAYTYDALGNLASRRNNRYGTVETFSYDALGRLVRVDCNMQSATVITYDAAGNITGKTGVGTYTYEEGSNRLMSVSGTVKVWDDIKYCSLDKITAVKSGSNVLYLDYGPDKSRVMATCNGTVRYYIGGLYEMTDDGHGHTEHTSYIYALGRAVAMVKGRGNGSDLYYMSHDHIGSVVTIADYRRAIVQELDYDAWGRRRDPMTLACNVWDVKDDHGFAGHEHLDLFDMVNMDGRMYDPVAGRFLSPDPLVQAPDFTQSLNRYAYCLNNPLSLVDPTGYSWFSRSWKSIAAAVVGIAVSAVTLGSATSLGMAIAAGAAGGAASALTGSLLNGANIGQIAKATFAGGVWGAASGLLNNISADKDILASLFKHAFTEGALEGIQGGNVFHGMYSGAVSAFGNKLTDKYASNIGKAGELTVSSIVGGTIEEMGGGKFANGALTSAFSMLFNDMMHRDQDESYDDDFYTNDSQSNAQYIAQGAFTCMVALGADDMTGIGAIDDIAIPFIGVVCLGATAYHYVFEQGDTNKQNGVFLYSEHTKNKSHHTKDKHTKRRAGGRYDVNTNANRGNKNKKHEHPINPNKRRYQ